MKISMILILILLMFIPLVSAEDPNVTRGIDQPVLLYDSDTGIAINTAYVTLLGTPTDRFKPTIFTENINPFLEVVYTNPVDEHNDDSLGLTMEVSGSPATTYTFTGTGDTVTYGLKVRNITNTIPQCIGNYSLTGTFKVPGDGENNFFTGDTNTTTVRTIPITSSTITDRIFVWDTNHNNKIEKSEVLDALAYWFVTPSFTRTNMFLIIKKYFDQSDVVPNLELCTEP